MPETPTKTQASASQTARATHPIEIVLVGAGARARSWLGPLRGSSRLRLVASVARGSETIAPDLPRFESIGHALRECPDATFALALPPRAGLEAALEVAQAERAAVVEAPLYDALADVQLGPGAKNVRVAHGWVTLPGLRGVQAVMRRMGRGRISIVAAGLPEEDHCDLIEALVHGLALVRALLPQGVVSSVRRADTGGLEVELETPHSGAAWTLGLRAQQHGQRLEARVEGSSEVAVWSWRDDRETLLLDDRPLIPSRATPSAAVRALAQILPDAGRGDGLAEAADVLRLTRRCLAALPAQLPLGGRVLRQSASIAQRRPADLLGRLGLRGDLPGSGEPPPKHLRLTLPPEPFEVWPFRAGIKPVAFLTVQPEDVDRTLAYFGDVHHERRERRVQVGAQDRWTDRRDEGEPRVELYISRDAELAQRAAHLQAEVDPTTAMREIGELVGYPPCCVEAFASQDDRANNSLNRYHSRARTLRADGSTRVPWPWELNNLHTMIVPFYPCSYWCEGALAWARACLEQMALVHSVLADELRTSLAMPVLYFDHDHQLAFDGRHTGGRIEYDSVRQVESSSSQFIPLATAIGLGNRLTLDDRELIVERDGQALLRLFRTDPALGFIAPFGLP